MHQIGKNGKDSVLDDSYDQQCKFNGGDINWYNYFEKQYSDVL